MRLFCRRMLCLTLLLVTLGVNAIPVDTYTFDTPQQEQLFHELVAELRCPKCQNNSLADSDAELARDLRQLVYEKVRAGESRDAIIDYLVERYGPFIHYQPPESVQLVILVPVLLFMLGAAAWAWWWVKRSGSGGADRGDA